MEAWASALLAVWVVADHMQRQLDRTGGNSAAESVVGALVWVEVPVVAVAVAVVEEAPEIVNAATRQFENLAAANEPLYSSSAACSAVQICP